jgi:hypothetical protein
MAQSCRRKLKAFSSQAESLGGSENATKQQSQAALLRV